MGILSESNQQLLRKWMIPLPDALKAQVLTGGSGDGDYLTPWTIPGSSLLTPIAYGANWGDLFAAFSLTNRSRFGVAPDSRAGFGFGIGNARKWVGIEVALSMLDVSGILPWNSAGAIGVKIHRMLPMGFGVAIGMDNIVQWEGPDSGRSFYAVVSKAFFFSQNEQKPFSLAFLHAGIGDGNFQTEEDILAGRRAMNWFASGGIRIFRPLALIVNWYGSDLGVGLSIAPFRKFRFVITPNIQDLTGTAGDGMRFMISFAFSDSFTNPAFSMR